MADTIQSHLAPHQGGDVGHGVHGQAQAGGGVGDELRKPGLGVKIARRISGQYLLLGGYSPQQRGGGGWE